MEFVGVLVDVNQLKSINDRLTAQCLALTKQLHQVAKQEFNPQLSDSTAQDTL